MKKIIAILSILCIFLSGCSIQNTSSTPVRNLKVYKNERDFEMLRREIGEDLYLDIYLDQLHIEPEVNVVLHKRTGDLLAVNTTEGVLMSDIQLEFNEDRSMLTMYERMTYYAENDFENHFTYDKVTKMTYQDLVHEFPTSTKVYGFKVGLPTGCTKNIKTDTFGLIASMKESLSVGLFSMYELSYIVGMITLIISVLMVSIIFISKVFYRPLCDHKYEIEPTLSKIFTGLMVALFVVLKYKGEPVFIVVLVDVAIVITLCIKFVIHLDKWKDLKNVEK